MRGAGGELPVEKGLFNLFVDQGDPSRKRMLYRLFLRDGDGRPLTLSGFKVVEDDPALTSGPTRPPCSRILRGHVGRRTRRPWSWRRGLSRSTSSTSSSS